MNKDHFKEQISETLRYVNLFKFTITCLSRIDTRLRLIQKEFDISWKEERPQQIQNAVAFLKYLEEVGVNFDRYLQDCLLDYILEQEGVIKEDITSTR